MAELTQRERLQPSLLDRLIDDEPDKQVESRERRVLSLQRLREVVMRDLVWLFNAGNLGSTEDLQAYPQVANSVLNYGLPHLSGRTVATIDVAAIERQLRQAIWDFEPRILRPSLRVRLVVNEDQMNHNAMTFDIEGELWAQPVPMRIYLRTELDLEIGTVRVSDYAGSGGA